MRSADGKPKLEASVRHSDPRHLSEDVAPKCVRCGYDLRGLREARCPECAWNFRWDDVFDSAAMERKRDYQLFEFAWKQRPVRSFLRTVGKSFIPWRLWLQMPRVREPRVEGLLVLVPLTAFFYTLTTFMHHSLAHCFTSYIDGFTLSPPFTPIPFDWANLSWYIADGLHYSTVLAALAWLSLQVARRTIIRFRVEQHHLARVCILSWVPTTMIQAFWNLLLTPLSIWVYWFEPSVVDLSLRNTIFGHPLTWSLVKLFLFAITMCLGLSLYVKIRRGWIWGAVAMSMVLVTFAFLNLRNVADAWPPDLLTRLLLPREAEVLLRADFWPWLFGD